MTYPSDSFQNDLKKIYLRFCQFHPADDIRREPGIITSFSKHLADFFPNYDDKVLYFISKTLTLNRLREMNENVRKQRLLKTKIDAPYSLRGKNQISRFASN